MANEVTLEKTSKFEIEDAQIRTVASMVISGSSINRIAQELSTTRHHIKKIMNTQQFRDLVKEQSEEVLITARNTLKAAITERVPELIRVLDKHLKDDNLEAVKLAFKSLGMEAVEQQQASSNLTVVLPGFDQPKTIEVD